MKKQITQEQWDELNEKEEEKYYKEVYGDLYETGKHTATFWVKTAKYLPTIGDMIEFLGGGENEWIDDKYNYWAVGCQTCNIVIGWQHKEELCDELWEEVKKKLKYVQKD